MISLNYKYLVLACLIILSTVAVAVNPEDAPEMAEEQVNPKTKKNYHGSNFSMIPYLGVATKMMAEATGISEKNCEHFFVASIFFMMSLCFNHIQNP